MGRTFVTGDCHGSLDKVINFIKKFDLKEGDSIIVCGDLALAWRKDQKDYNYHIENYEANCNGVNLYWIDGNHENFDIIKSWNCEKEIYNNSPHIHYCPRGSELIIGVEVNENHTILRKCLCLGGADSVDKFRRTKHLSWWEEETITEDDIRDIEGNYYYVFTHCCPYSVFNSNRIYLCTLDNITESNAIHESEYILDKVKDNIKFEKWFFGHYHVNKELEDGKFQCLLDDFIELS